MTQPMVQQHADFDDVGPGPFERAGMWLGLSDGAAPLVRYSAPWWTRAALFVVVLAIVGTLVAFGG